MIRHWTPESLSIDASAGYGKTQRLCTRLLAHFLADRDATRNTIALTFTKPAAGEIYGRMLQMLSSALLDDKEFQKLRAALPEAFEAVSRDELHELLARLIGDMGKLNISTIDSFFYRLVRVFAVELGMPGRVELDESGGESPVTEALLCELFSSSGASEELLDACRNSRVGDEKKTFFESCRGLLKLVQNFRAQRTVPEFWGGGFGVFSPKSRTALKQALDRCEAQCWPGKYQTTLGPLLRRCAEATDHPEKFRFTLEDKTTLRRFLAVWKDFPAQAPERFDRGWDYAPVADELRLLLGNGRDVLLYQCAMRTRGLRTLLEEYHRLYEQRLLRRGRINFADLPLLLAENAAAPESVQEFLNEIRYRTNSRFKHVLIDEFQDTSRAQWHVLDPITEDNGDGDHSLFIVGDVKQAIYGWREGDSKLMGEVTARRALKPAPLERSFRYGPDICRALNCLFGALPERIRGLDGIEPEIPAGAFDELARRWEGVFRPHRTAREDRGGEFEVLAFAPTSYVCAAVNDPHAEDIFPVLARAIVERLEQVGFFSGRKSVTAALLVRDGGNGIRLRDALRNIVAPEYADRIVWEGSESIVNDPLVASLLAFGVWLQHPADTFSREAAALNLLLRDLLPDTPESRLEWLTLLAERGIAGFLRGTLERLAARARSMTDDAELAAWSPVENGDVDALLALAAAVDASGAPRDLLRFRELAAARRKKAAAVAGKLQIMTIHHSKGLTFDMVFHPMFKPAKTGTGNWRSMQDNLPVTGGDGEPEWLINAPRAEGMTVPEIAGAVTARHIDNCFEELCNLYVALTRARYGMYVLLPPRSRAKCAAYHCDWAPWKFNAKTGEWSVPKYSARQFVSGVKGQSCYISDLVFDAFFADTALFPDAPGGLPLAGDPDAPYLRRVFGREWSATALPEKSGGVKKLVCNFRDAGQRLCFATPSQLEETRQLHFALPRPDGGEMLGTRIHGFFESIGRWRDFTPPADTPPEVLEHYRACAANPALTGLLDEECELWRERRFDVVLRDGEGNAALVTGCFDRVQIRRAADGGVERACIIDYKSNQATADDIPELRERYRRQLESYRAALAALLGVTPNLIDCRIVFTRIGMIAEV